MRQKYMIQCAPVVELSGFCTTLYTIKYHAQRWWLKNSRKHSESLQSPLLLAAATQWTKSPYNSLLIFDDLELLKSFDMRPSGCQNSRNLISKAISFSRCCMFLLPQTRSDKILLRRPKTKSVHFRGARAITRGARTSSKGPYFNYISTFLTIFDQLSNLVLACLLNTVKSEF